MKPRFPKRLMVPGPWFPWPAQTVHVQSTLHQMGLAGRGSPRLWGSSQSPISCRTSRMERGYSQEIFLSPHLKWDCSSVFGLAA